MVGALAGVVYLIGWGLWGWEVGLAMSISYIIGGVLWTMAV